MFFKLSLLGLFFLTGCVGEGSFDQLPESEGSMAYPLLNDVPEKPEDPLWEAYEKDISPTKR
jgi:hypothetical protein